MPWYHPSWLYRFKITTDETKLEEAVDNVVYDLANAPAAFWTHVNSDGGDIRVTRSDGESEVAREVSGFNQGSQVGSLFFDGIGLSISVNTERYVYYGNSGASEPAAGATYGKNAVWASHLMVAHLDEASGNVTESRSNVTGTNTGVALAATGKLRTGGTWAEATDNLNFGNNFGITAASLTVSAWINPTLLSTNYYVAGKCDASTRNGYLLLVDGTNDRPRLQICNATTNNSHGGTNTVLTTGVWQWIVATLDGSFARFYVDGVAKGTSAWVLDPTDTTSNFRVGIFPGSDLSVFQGIIDEVRVSTSVRSQNWITTEFNNQTSPSTFWTTGSEEQDVVATPTLLWLPRQLTLRGPRGLMTPSGPVPPVTPEA